MANINRGKETCRLRLKKHKADLRLQMERLRCQPESQVSLEATAEDLYDPASGAGTG